MINPSGRRSRSPNGQEFFEQIIKKYRIKKGRRSGVTKDRRKAVQRFSRPVCLYRTDTPDRSVNIRAAMFIEASSWNKSLAAYGMWTWEMRCLLLQRRHSKRPFLSLLEKNVSIWLLKKSERRKLTRWGSSDRSRRKCEHGTDPTHRTDAP